MSTPADSVLLTVIVPVYNEAATIDELLRRLSAAPYPDKQIVIVDDGSTDGTSTLLERWSTCPNVTHVRHPANRGKGAAVRTGLHYARGAITVIQDADLEYDPNDLPRVIEPIRSGRAIAVYGSRYLAPDPRLPWSRFRVAVVLLNWLVQLLFRQRLTDEAACYKAMPTALYRDLDLCAERFELCPEITAKLCRRGIPIHEVPVTYRPRTAADGKKIGWRDAWITVWTLCTWRFASVPWNPPASSMSRKT